MYNNSRPSSTTSPNIVPGVGYVPNQLDAPSGGNTRRRRSRLLSLNGLALHLAIGHPPERKFCRWRKMADGFPPNLRGYVHRCDGCSARMAHRPVHSGTTVATKPCNIDPDVAKGT